jgi:uncharacterized membrane protein YhaH (DUF805 family)
MGKKNATAAVGLLGAAWIVGSTIIGGAMYPGYDHAAQYISELGASGAPHAALVNYLGFLPSGVLLASFAVLSWRALPRSTAATLGMVGLVLYSVGYLGAVAFPCDFGCRPDEPSASQALHNLFGLAGYLFAPATLFALGLAARRWRDGARLSWLGRIAAVPALVGLLALESEHGGAAQRLLEACVLAWVAACALYLWRRSDV